jgi:hypothetical protein
MGVHHDAILRRSQKSMLGARPRRSHAQHQQGGGTTELDQLLADRPGFIEPGRNRDPRLEFGSLCCPDNEKRLGFAVRIVNSSIVAD